MRSPVRTLLILTVGCLPSTAGAQDAPKDDNANIQGTWKPISSADSGRNAPAEAIEKLRLVITKDRISYKFGDPVEKEKGWSYKLDSTKQPKWIDLTSKENTTTGIYELDGDNLKICFPEEKQLGRSTAFESKPDSPNDVLIVLKRVQPGASGASGAAPDSK
jgi:uncharacterized protein (TIGR03067 family)